MSETTHSGATFDRLLQAAVEVFAEYGFREATVREICTRATVNVASINYYFRSKEALYTQALLFAFQESHRLYPQDAASNHQLPAEQRLQLFIDNFLHKLLDDSHLGFHGRLIMREIAEPTKAFDDIINTMIVPHFTLLSDIVRLIIGEAADNTVVNRCVSSILGQCLMFKHSRSVIDRLYPELIADENAIHASVEHITQFSLAALKAIGTATKAKNS